MIIQVRGTSGSGKSTVVRKVMEKFGDWEPMYVEGRTRPLYYRASLRNSPNDLIALGHYESPCGGGDTIGSAPKIYKALLSLPPYRVALTEGLLWSEDTKWTRQLKGDLRIIFLTTPPEECLRRIEERRKAAGNERPLNPKNTLNRVTVIEKARVILTKEGFNCIRCSSEQAPELILKWILD